jgi:hypothetical protein
MNTQTLTQEYLKSILYYDVKTGLFTWLTNKARSIKVGDIAGSPHIRGYTAITINGKLYLAHRLAWLYVYGNMPNVIDHVDRNTTNNKIENLRDCSNSQNGFNKAIAKNNKSGFKNVCWDKFLNKWKVQLKVNNKHHHIGVFDNLEFAGLVALEARNKYHKEYANHD